MRLSRLLVKNVVYRPSPHICPISRCAVAHTVFEVTSIHGEDAGSTAEYAALPHALKSSRSEKSKSRAPGQLVVKVVVIVDAESVRSFTSAGEVSSSCSQEVSIVGPNQVGSFSIPNSAERPSQSA